MPWFAAVTEEERKRISEAADRHAAAGDLDAAWRTAQQLVLAQRDPLVARALIGLVRRNALPFDKRIDVLKRAFELHRDEPVVVMKIGAAYESAHDINLLNAAPPEDPFPHELAAKLKEQFDAGGGAEEDRYWGADALFSVGRLLGRKWDDATERAQKRVCEMDGGWGPLYALGLFYKTRGRFKEGLEANQRAAAAGGADQESVQWNTIICATGAGEGELALKLQQKMGVKVGLGPHGLPMGRFDEVKVRVAERPLASRTAADDTPGREENIWVQRLSVCHGVVRSVLYEPGGADYGDTVLFDGAPITHHTVEGRGEVPLFPQLVTLHDGGYRFWDFAGTQAHERQLGRMTDQLPQDSVLYVHTEQVAMLCAACSNGDPTHTHREVEHHVVRGRIAAPPQVKPAELLKAIDAAVARSKGARVLAPQLCTDAGDAHRAEVELRRLNLLLPLPS